jgi:hypothetical protein
MLTIRLVGPFGRWSKTLAPSTCFRAVGASLRSLGDREIAVYRAGRWHRTSSSGSLFVLTGPFEGVAIESPTVVRFEDPAHHETRELKLVGHVRLDDAQLHIENGSDHLVARLDEEVGQWLSDDDHRHWPVVVFADPSSGTPPGGDC